MARILLLMLGMFGLVSVMLAILPDLTDINEETRTDPTTATGLACTTGVGETSCIITIPTNHQYSDTTQMTVTETSPSSVDRTSTTAVGSDRTSLSVSGLASSTSFLFDVDYREIAANVSAGLNDFLRQVPVFVVIGIFAVALLATVAVIGGRPGGAFSR